MFEHPRPTGGSTSTSIGTGRLEIAALFLVAVLAVICGWWAWKEGAYFSTVLLPGVILLCIATVLLAVLAPWRGNLRLSPPAAVGLVALIALAGWTALSAIWSAAPDIAVIDGERVLTYALVFGLGIWLGNLLGPRMELSLVPVAAGAGFAGIATIVALFGSNPRDLLEVDGTLDFPLGYRNANVAFFAIALFPAVSLAANRALDWRARGVALGIASLAMMIFLLGQSRASLPAMGVAVLVYILLSPYRLKSICWLGLAIVPALLVVPSALSLYSAANGVFSETVDEMNGVAWMLTVASVASVVLGAFAARFEARLPGIRSADTDSNRVIGRTLIAGGVVLVIGFFIVVGDPVKWVGDRATEFTETGSPDLSSSSSRFSFNVGSVRNDLWRVALDDFADDPLFGDGAGGYQYTYLLKREGGNHYARDAHSVELEQLAELGILGFALIVTAIVAIGLAAFRPRKLGPAASTLSAAALASGAYWLVHASVDWFWAYPAVTAIVLVLLGAAASPSVLAVADPEKQRWRRPLIIAAVLLAIVAIPPLLSERYVDSAYDGWRDDPEQAYSDLDAAHSIYPLSDTPLLAEGAIARELGDEERAIEALADAVDFRPWEWAGHFLLAELYADNNPLLARNEARIALELNPRSERVQELAATLGVR